MPADDQSTTSTEEILPEARAAGGRKARANGAPGAGGELLPGGASSSAPDASSVTGLTKPSEKMGITKPIINEDEEKSSLKIRIKLDLHVRVKLDADIYGDIEIGLL